MDIVIICHKMSIILTYLEFYLFYMKFILYFFIGKFFLYLLLHNILRIQCQTFLIIINLIFFSIQYLSVFLIINL
jgi:hypothetical protein